MNLRLKKIFRLKSNPSLFVSSPTDTTTTNPNLAAVFAENDPEPLSAQTHGELEAVLFESMAPLAIPFALAGFEFCHSGGGFESWAKNAGRHHSMTITCDGQLPGKWDEPCLFSILNGEGLDDISFKLTVSEALALSAKLF